MPVCNTGTSEAVFNTLNKIKADETKTGAMVPEMDRLLRKLLQGPRSSGPSWQRRLLLTLLQGPRSSGPSWQWRLLLTLLQGPRSSGPSWQWRLLLPLLQGPRSSGPSWQWRLLLTLLQGPRSHWCEPLGVEMYFSHTLLCQASEHKRLSM
ncbi:hypothetical protein EOD39_8771 [Acipenser ruthenus]|uniref:Uncharacterized protein n=1 Tax=Acipenser ruthenus TaxID=7906 RepID=A0A662YW63_ACIRT|nr:hypothetical protein EOD39_8771 [Acipenser ruthenus]